MVNWETHRIVRAEYNEESLRAAERILNAFLDKTVEHRELHNSRLELSFGTEYVNIYLITDQRGKNYVLKKTLNSGNETNTYSVDLSASLDSSSQQARSEIIDGLTKLFADIPVINPKSAGVTE